MSLDEYRRKRRPGKTPEPTGKGRKRRRKSGEPRFVIQQHSARRLKGKQDDAAHQNQPEEPLQRGPAIGKRTAGAAFS